MITPSIVLSSAEETWPLSASARAMVGRPACNRNAAALTLVSSQRFLDRILFSQELVLLSGRTAESNASPGRIAARVSGLRPGAASEIRRLVVSLRRPAPLGEEGRGDQALVARQACHTFSGVAGIESRAPPSPGIALAMAIMIVAMAPVVAASPTPFTPSGLVVAGTEWMASRIAGMSSAWGMA